MTGATGAVAERLGDVALADTGGPHQQHVLVTRNEVTRRQVDDTRFGHSRVEVEVEVLERLRLLEASPPKPQLKLFAVAALGLVGEQSIEKLDVRKVVVGGLAHAQLERLQHARHAQLLQDRDQVVS